MNQSAYPEMRDTIDSTPRGGRALRISSRHFIAFAALAVSACTLVFLIRPASNPPTHAEVASLAETGQVDAAEKKIALLLKQSPDDPGVNLLASQISMSRCETVTNSGVGSDPKPALDALEFLSRIKSSDKTLQALAKLSQGKAERYLGHLDTAEEAWLKALELNPTVPEAGWLLLQEYYLQDRSQEARALALRLHQSEPDPGDRVRFLFEPFRQDVMPPDPLSLVLWFEPLANQDPKGLRANMAYGLALVRTNEQKRGMELLRKTVENHPQRPEAWRALLAGLDEQGDVKGISEILKSQGDFSTAPWTARYRGRVAEVAGDWKQAACAYRQALQEFPADNVLIFRLARAVRLEGKTDEANQLSEQHRARTALKQEARAIFDKIANNQSLSLDRYPGLYEEIAVLREKMGYPEQAAAWRQLTATQPAAIQPPPGLVQQNRGF